ncbi:SgcJ/EcaC family oxidoreductase [Bacillus sp. NEB1478]|uniref:SgcJ/EcaC family oxidoreductase n=1 Tax=Bacillus sp. NEB1478 TaxID=3073816 RepID=UPI0028734557|nr:SgcJ/EcaC family oxidoreductase [Bacillus sp. NEB1478]WNB91733.1 SgcJ/EcaC family oxidoreductase [Bacillus sp. NEB1478]
MASSEEKNVQALYQNFLAAWNDRSARDMADYFLADGEIIGFDGSQVIGKKEIYSHLHPIFENHPTPPYFGKVKNVSFLSEEAAVIRAIAGMVPEGKTEIVPELNTHQTLIAVKSDAEWRIKLFQNTPAQFHGRPELVEQMTAELSDLLDK